MVGEERTMKEIVRELYSCPKRQCPLNGVGFSSKGRPEPFLGSLQQPTLAIIGINPGKKDETTSENRFWDENSYLECYLSEEGKCRKALIDRWTLGYLVAYKILIKNDLNKPAEENLDEFNNRVTKLNIIKCPTREKPLNKQLDEARNNCLPYLIDQLKQLQPRVILFHSRFACSTAVEMIRSGVYNLHNASRDLDDLDDPSKVNMDDISSEFIIARDWNDRKTLFLFNWHLSWSGRACKGIKNGLEKKHEIIKEILKNNSAHVHQF